MNKIMKSYLKTFFKNWLSTLFMIIFIVTLAASVIGMLATPLQIYSKMHSAQKENIAYDSNFSSADKDMLYSEEFITSYAKEYLDPEFIKLLNAKLWAGSSESNKKDNEYYADWTKLSAEEKERMTLQVNSSLKRYRLSSNSTAFELQYKNEENYQSVFSFPTPQEIFQYHVKKSLELGLYDLDIFLQNDEETNIYSSVSSIGFSILFRIFNFAYTNGINFNIPSNVTINKLEDLIAIVNKSIASWKPKSVKISSYTAFNSEYSKLLADEKYQHDDRILLFNKILNNENNKSNYKIDINKNFLFKKSETGVLTSSQTFEIRTDSTNEFNKVVFDRNSKKSKIPENWGLNKTPEIIISSAYAKQNNIKIGDEIKMPIAKSNNLILSSLLSNKIIQNILPTEYFFANQLTTVKVVGIGQTFDDFVPGSNFSPFSQSMKTYGFIYLNQKFINEFRNYSWNLLNNEASYTLQLKIKNMNDEKGVPFELFTTQDKIKILSNLETNLVPWSETKVAKALENLQIRIIINVVLGSIILVLAFLFINFQLKKEMNETRKQLGIFKSFGYKTSELSWIFSIKTGILFFISLIFGFFISIPIQVFAALAFENTVSISFSTIYISPFFLLFLFVVIPLIFVLISYITTILYIKEPVLSLMSNGKKTKNNIKQGILFKKVFAGERFFNWRLRRAFVRTSKGKFYTVQTLFACASFTYILLFGAQNLMAKMINQSFAVYNEKTDHYYSWWNSNPTLDIIEGTDKFNYKYETNKLSPTYNDYSQYKNTNDYLKKTSSEEYRFRIDAVIQMTNNYFMNLSSIDKKVNFLLPRSEMYFILNNMLNINTKDLDVEEDNINSFIGTIMSYNLNSQDSTFIKAVEEIKETGKTLEKINFSENLNENNILTIASMKSDMVKHIFTKDLSYIYAVKIAQIDLTISALQEIIGKPNQVIQIKDLIAANTTKSYIDNAYEKLYANMLVDKFDMHDTRQRNLVDNWLLTQIDDIFAKDIKEYIPLLVRANFSSMNSVATNVFQSTQLTDFDNYDENDYMLNINNVMYDKKNEVLFDWIGLKQSGQYNDVDVYARLVNTKTDQYGSFENMFNFEEVSNSQMARFNNSAQENAQSNIVNAIIPYSMARNQNIKIDDIIDLKTKTLSPKIIQLRVVGINKAETIKLGSDNIWINSEDFKAKFYEESLPIMFSSLYSKNKMISANTNTSDFMKLFYSIKIIEKNSSILINEDLPIMLDILRPIFKYTNSLSPNIITNLKSVVNPYFLNFSSRTSTISFVINNLVINKATEIVNKVMLIFVLLTTLLLAIILVVIIGIIVEEAKIIILTLQALGYKDKEINWTVMGSYAIGALISFVVAYLGSVIFWKILLNWIAGKFSVYVFMSVDLKTMLITLAVMSVVILFGWYASNKQVKRNPLTQITSLA
ncbi:ABC transporter permease [Mesoplasma tabanidae]|nr:ABC transporter permease [Mesoplasma tabanidae]